MTDDDHEDWECDSCGFIGRFRSPWNISIVDVKLDSYYIPCPFCDGSMREVPND